MLVALVASLTLVLVGPYAGGLREQAATLVSQIDFNQVVLHGMLAFLLFAGSIHVNLDELGREWLTVSLLAIVGTLVSTYIVGGMTWLVLRWLDLGIPFLHALLFGALISPTDPIAVLGIMKSVGASRQLEVQVAGESHLLCGCVLDPCPELDSGSGDPDEQRPLSLLRGGDAAADRIRTKKSSKGGRREAPACSANIGEEVTMPVTLFCPAYANITMFGDVAVRLLKLMGHSGTVPGGPPCGRSPGGAGAS